MQSKLDVIHDAYGTIKQAAESDSYDTEEFARELDDVCRSYNMTVCVMDVNSNMKYVSINGGETGKPPDRLCIWTQHTFQ